MLTMKPIVLGLLVIILFGCSSRQDNVQQTKTVSLPDLGPAPELMNDSWLNVDSPLRIADLRGKVVIVEMWAFG